MYMYVYLGQQRTKCMVNESLGLTVTCSAARRYSSFHWLIYILMSNMVMVVDHQQWTGTSKYESSLNYLNKNVTRDWTRFNVPFDSPYVISDWSFYPINLSVIKKIDISYLKIQDYKQHIYDSDERIVWTLCLMSRFSSATGVIPRRCLRSFACRTFASSTDFNVAISLSS